MTPLTPVMRSTEKTSPDGGGGRGSWPREGALAGILAGGLFTFELLVARTVLDPEAGLGTYPLVLWVACFLVGVVTFGVLRGLSTLASTGVGIRVPGFLSSPWGTSLLLAAALLLLHAHQLRVPRTVTAVDEAVFKTVPLLVACLLGLRIYLRRRRADHRLFWPVVAASLALLGGLTFLGRAAPGTSEYRGPWPTKEGLSGHREIGRVTKETTPETRAIGREGDGTNGDEVSTELLIVGLDGADWGYIDPLLRRRMLPNLQRLIDAGVRGVLANEDVDRYVSPVAWTSIVTGTLPEQHRVRTWGSPPTGLPRIWEMLELTDGPRRPLIMNLPGTFPVRSGSGFRTAGMVAPGVVSGTGEGWMVTKRPGLGPSRGPLDGRFVRDPSCTGGHRLSLPSDRFRLSENEFRNTSPGIGLTILATSLRDFVARALSRTVRPALTACAGYEPSGGTLVLGVDDDSPVRIEPQEWSPWLEFDTEGRRTVTRIKNITEDPTEPTFYVGALTELMVEGLADPVQTLEVARTSRPWLSPATDSFDFVQNQSSETLIALNVEWALSAEAGRVETALALLEESDWTDVVYILGSTDRLHHVLVTEIVSHEEAGNAGVLPELARVYVTADRWLGQLVAHAGDDAAIAVVSDHGSRAGQGYHLNHGPEGIYVLVAPTLPAGVRGPDLVHEDLVPVLLAHLGRPTASDLPGTVPDALWPRDRTGERLELPQPIPSYEALFDVTVGEEADESIDPEVLEQLRSLGYIQ